MANINKNTKKGIASELRSDKVRPFNAKAFVRRAKVLRAAIEKEERKYGGLRDPQAIL